MIMSWNCCNKESFADWHKEEDDRLLLSFPYEYRWEPTEDCMSNHYPEWNRNSNLIPQVPTWLSDRANPPQIIDNLNQFAIEHTKPVKYHRACCIGYCCLITGILYLLISIGLSMIGYIVAFIVFSVGFFAICFVCKGGVKAESRANCVQLVCDTFVAELNEKYTESNLEFYVVDRRFSKDERWKHCQHAIWDFVVTIDKNAIEPTEMTIGVTTQQNTVAAAIIQESEGVVIQL
eukprot:486701_1